MNRFLHSGHIGDIIAFLACMKTMGGGELVITDDDGNVHLKMSGFKYESIEPLIAYQNYISRVWFSNNHAGVTHDLRQFRKHWGRGNIVVLHAAELGIEPKYDKWIEANPSTETKGRIVCCRSPRYRNYNFPWRKILKRIGDRALFVGTDDEHADMERLTGIKIDRHHVNNCLDIAEAIAGSNMFIGNQSSPYWVAAGLNHPCIQETNMITPDSMIQYEGAHFCINGFVDMGIFEKYGI